MIFLLLFFFLFEYITYSVTVLKITHWNLMLHCYVPSMSCCHCFLFRYKATVNKVWLCNTIHLIVALSSVKLFKIYVSFKYIYALQLQTYFFVLGSPGLPWFLCEYKKREKTCYRHSDSKCNVEIWNLIDLFISRGFLQCHQPDWPQLGIKSMKILHIKSTARWTSNEPSRL